MTDNLIYKLRVIHGKMREQILKIWKVCSIMRAKLVLIGTPTHPNIGDSAIAQAERLYLSQFGKVVEITAHEFLSDRQLFKKYIKKKHIICLYGGGNMGDIWPYEEDLRRNILEDYDNNMKFIFPQTLYYSNPKAEEQSKKWYQSDNIVMMGREKTSYLKMKELYPKATVLYVPDIVLSTSKNDWGITTDSRERKGTLLCIRSDVERAISDKDVEQIKLMVHGHLYCTDMLSDRAISQKNRKEIIKNKMNEVARAQMVITDRLHMMIFSAITETPCIVLSNNHHKVKGVYSDWLSQLPYIYFADSLEDIKIGLEKISKVKECKFDNSVFEPYFNKINRAMEGYLLEE